MVGEAERGALYIRQICHKCEVWNPMGQYERHFLGLPSPLALPPSMVRRVLVAYLGRRQYTLATHTELLKLEQMRGSSTSLNYDSSGDLNQCGMHFQSVNLPFVLYEGMAKSLIQKRDGKLHCGCFEASATQSSQMVPLRACCGQEHSKAECHVLTDSAKQEHLNMNYMGSPSAEIRSLESEFHLANKLNKDAYTNKCDACDGNCQAACQKMLQTGKLGLWWLQEQLVQMHCPETLSRDLHNTSLQYPICSFKKKSCIKILGNRCCNVQAGGHCAPKEFGSFSLSLLQLGMSFLTSQLEDWLSEKQIPHSGASQYLVDIFSTADLFIRNKTKILESQNAVCRASIAQKQAIQDCITLSQEQIYSSVGSLLKNALVKSIEEKTAKWKKDMEPFYVLLNQINLFLEFCYSEAYNIQTLHGSIDPHQISQAEEVNTLIEVMSTVVSSFLLLYHDVAHAVNIL